MILVPTLIPRRDAEARPQRLPAIRRGGRIAVEDDRTGGFAVGLGQVRRLPFPLWKPDSNYGWFCLRNTYRVPSLSATNRRTPCLRSAFDNSWPASVALVTF